MVSLCNGFVEGVTAEVVSLLDGRSVAEEVAEHRHLVVRDQGFALDFAKVASLVIVPNQYLNQQEIQTMQHPGPVRGWRISMRDCGPARLGWSCWRPSG